ncbi:beta-glucosidase BglX [Paremcibacter congregatus]|nr:beta-glucosidase BglX [Paremcibacter congregatus]
MKSSRQAKASSNLWHDNKAEMEAFISDLMSRMTLEEKIGQLNLLSSGWDVTGPRLQDNSKALIKEGKVGAIFNAYTAEYTHELQKMAVEKTRLGIPLLFGYDVIHGFRTIFPISLGEAASWDLAAIEKSARISAIEATAEGLHWTFAPMVDITRDPRWGRISEGAGEDVYLGMKIATARVRGYQGNDLSRVDTMLATAKHFAAYGQSQAGRDYHSTDMSERELWGTYLPPFKAALDAGVASVMTAFNDLNGIPATGNALLLNDILKGQWDFQGLVVTDYTSINEMVPHGFARDEKHAGELAINAGVDMDMQGSVFVSHLKGLVDEGKVSVVKIDRAVRRILEMKYRLGLFEDPYRYSNEARQQAAKKKPAFLEAARDVARKSMVLLKNEGQILPLKKQGISIAVIGPLGDSKQDMIGSWSAAGDRMDEPVSLLEGIRAKVGGDVVVHYAKGASYAFNDHDQSGFAEAMAIAEKSDVIIMAMGEKWDMTGEAASRTSLDMPGSQQALMEALHKIGKPMVLVLMNGRPLALNWADDNVNAILETWYAGTMGGHAIADILFGDYNPAGKLPVTFPRHVGQVPLYYNMKNTGRPYASDGAEQKYRSRYLNTLNDPLYPFGYGLSYTQFSYSEVILDRPSLGPKDVLTATINVANSGGYDGEEVVQLYIQDVTGSVTRPVKELKGFQKIHLAVGEHKNVSFKISAKDLSFYRQDMSYGVEAGDFKLYIGTNSMDVKEARFTLTNSGT